MSKVTQLVRTPDWLAELFPLPRRPISQSLCSLCAFSAGDAGKGGPGLLNAGAGGSAARTDSGKQRPRKGTRRRSSSASTGGPAQWVWDNTGHEAAPESPEPRGPALPLEPTYQVTLGE